MSNFIMITLNGLTYAGLLFLCASGLTLIFGMMQVVNMSHGILYLTGAYTAWYLRNLTDSWWIGILGGSIVIALLALLIKTTLLDRVLGNPENETLLTLGLNFILSDLLLIVFGGSPQSIQAPQAISSPVDLGVVRFPGIRLFILLAAALIGLGLWLLIQKTRVGQIIRAGVDDRGMVDALGIPVGKVFTLVFVLGGFLVGLSGGLGGSYLSFSSGSDASILTYSLVVVIVGGMGSLGGAAIGALLVGLADSYCKVFAPNWTSIVIFGSLMLILAFRRNGLLGKE